MGINHIEASWMKTMKQTLKDEHVNEKFGFSIMTYLHCLKKIVLLFYRISFSKSLLIFNL